MIKQRSRSAPIKEKRTSTKHLEAVDIEQWSRGRFLRKPPIELQRLIELANLLPVQVRHPRWARSGTDIEKWSWYIFYEEGALESLWQPGRNVLEMRGEWLRFLRAIRFLPLQLQAFILEDHDGVMIEGEGYRSPLRDFSTPPRDYNFEVLNKAEGEAEAIVRTACERFDLMLDLEEKVELPEYTQETTAFERQSWVVNCLDNEGREIEIGDRNFGYTSSERLLRRARQRWIFILAAQETLFCLTREDAWKEIPYRRAISSLYEGQSTLYLIQSGEEKGQLGRFGSPLDDLLLGVEFFDYDNAEKTGLRPNRVRVCAVCYRIFWAGRLDAEQCGDRKCKSTLSSRYSRKPELRELYNKARRKKRAKAERIKTKRASTAPKR